MRVPGRIVELFGGTLLLLKAPVGLQGFVVRLPVARGLVGGSRGSGGGPGRHGGPDLVVFICGVAPDHGSCKNKICLQKISNIQCINFKTL